MAAAITGVIPEYRKNQGAFIYHDGYRCRRIDSLYIIPPPGQHIDGAALKAYMKARLASYKVPKAFIEVDELPKSSAGKLLKREIREAYAAPKR